MTLPEIKAAAKEVRADFSETYSLLGEAPLARLLALIDAIDGVVVERATLGRWVTELGDTETLHDEDCELTSAALGEREAGPCSCPQGNVSRVVVEMSALLKESSG
jgi:hypothetical protein